MDGNRLLNVIRQASKNTNGAETDLVYGQVISTNPLQIKVDNRFVVDAEFITLSALCKDKTIIIKVGAEDVIIQVWKGLAVNDKVRMLKVHSGQMFYVIEKEGGAD